MDAVVLVGGEGTRLRPLTYDAPKQMLPIVDRPGICHVARWLAAEGVTRVVLSLGYRPDAFVEAFPDGSIEGLELCYAIEPELLDTAGAIRFAAEVGGIAERFIVLNGDVLTDFDAAALVSLHDKARAEASIHLTSVADPSAFGVVETDESGLVLEFVEKPPSRGHNGGFINAGTYVLEPSVLKRIPPGRRVSIERDIFPELVLDGSLFAVSSDAYWIDTGTPAKYIESALDILSGRRCGKGVLPEVPQHGPGVFCDPKADLPEDLLAHGVSGALFAGPGTRVGPGALLGDCVLCADNEIGEGATVTGSVLLPGAVVAENAAVRHSIIGPATVIGAGSRVESLSVVRGHCVLEPGTVLEAARFPAA
ncbi:MAG: sugar phosphate nucleotidyltransferase [Acidimicrobiales bacterium]